VKETTSGPPWLGQLFREILGTVLGPVFVRLARRLNRLEERVVASGESHVGTGIQLLSTQIADHSESLDERLAHLNRAFAELHATIEKQSVMVEYRFLLLETLLREAPPAAPSAHPRFPYARVPLPGPTWSRDAERLARQFVASHRKIETGSAASRRYFRRMLPGALTCGNPPLYLTPAFQTAIRLLQPPLRGAALAELVNSYSRIPGREKEVKAQLGDLIVSGLAAWSPEQSSPAWLRKLKEEGGTVMFGRDRLSKMGRDLWKHGNLLARFQILQSLLPALSDAGRKALMDEAWLGAAMTIPVDRNTSDHLRAVTQLVSRLRDVRAEVDAIRKTDAENGIPQNRLTPRDARTGRAIEALFVRFKDLPAGFRHPELLDLACETLGKPGSLNARWQNATARSVCERWLAG
jgi:hypothetical protein